MSKSKYTNLVCVIIICLTIFVTVLFMFGGLTGVVAVSSGNVSENVYFSEKDLDSSWNERTATYITLGDTVEIDGAGAAYEGGMVYIASAGTYVLSGEQSDVQIVVSAQDADVQLVLNGVNIEEADEPAIYVEDASHVYLTLEEGSENTISVTGELSAETIAEDLDAVIYSKCSLTVNGSGSVTVLGGDIQEESETEYDAGSEKSTETQTENTAEADTEEDSSTGAENDSARDIENTAEADTEGVSDTEVQKLHGIKSTDDLIITSGMIRVSTSGNALAGKDSVRICGGTFDLTAGNDGIKSNNDSDEDKGYILITDGEFTIVSAGDGIQAETELSIEGGNFDLTSGGGTDNAAAQEGDSFEMIDPGDGEAAFHGTGEGMPDGGQDMPDMDGGGDFSNMGDEASGSGRGGMPGGGRGMGDMPGRDRIEGGDQTESGMLESEQAESGMSDNEQAGGGAPENDQTEGSMPDNDQTEGDMPKSDKTEGGMPGGEWIEGDGLEGERPEGDLPDSNPDMGAFPGADGEWSESVPENMEGLPDEADKDPLTEESTDQETESETDSFKGLKSGTSILISGGTFDLNCADDALHSNGAIIISDGTFLIASGDDGVHADETLLVEGGEVTITSSYEGMEANRITITDGEIDITSSDDGINANGGTNNMGFDMGGMRKGGFGSQDLNDSNTSDNTGGAAIPDDTADISGGAEPPDDAAGTSDASESSIPMLRITGGTIHINADGDGLDSNGDLIVEGGLICVDGPVNAGNGSLDYGSENGGDCVIYEGTILALGASGMEEVFSGSSEQTFIHYDFTSNFAEGDELAITDAQGEVLFEYTVNKSGNCVIFSSAELTEGETYAVTVGEQTGEAVAGTDTSSSGMDMHSFRM